MKSSSRLAASRQATPRLGLDLGGLRFVLTIKSAKRTRAALADQRERNDLRRFAASHIANFVIRDASDRSRFFSVNEPVTLEEFNALCAAIIPASDRAPWVTARISKFGRENT
jgi:preprotein translocase subunit SecD